ncbi:hypothetical protein OG21DRAFT_1103438 [Imleria badia]|nr:hypothetical protein OG21DRAFT_1103438 [Imleria badia]
MELLNLARTCKSLRQLLMDSASAFVWKTARCQVDGLPDCPADLTEPELQTSCSSLVVTAVENTPRLFSEKSDTGIVWIPELLGGIPWPFSIHFEITTIRLCPLSSCHDVIRSNDVLAEERITIQGETTVWVDKEVSNMCMV